LGSVLYQLCTGKYPFEGPDTISVLCALAVDEPKPVQELNPAVPQSLAELIHQLLEKAPEKRPATADEVAQRLRKITESLAQPSAQMSITALPEPDPFAGINMTSLAPIPAAILKREPEFNWLWLAGGAVGVAVLLVGLIVGSRLIGGQTKKDPPDKTQDITQNNTVAPPVPTPAVNPPTTRAALNVSWQDNTLTIRGTGLPSEIQTTYLEGFCRPGSTVRDWDGETLIQHTTSLVSESDKVLHLRSRLQDGVVVDHTLTLRDDEVDFRLTATNGTESDSAVEWATHCVRLDKLTGATTKDQQALYPEYIKKCFVFVDGKLTRLPTSPWATEARFTPGQVYVPNGIDRQNVNPRPVSPITPSNGLIGAFSQDERWIVATAWEPYQELFQGVTTCIHSDFHIGGLKAGESKTIRGKLYIVPADVAALVKRYEKDFPEHSKVRGPISAPIADSDKEVALWVLKAGGIVRVNGEMRQIQAVSDLPAGRFALTSVDLKGRPVADADLANLQGLAELKELFLKGTRITDKGLAHLKDHPRLRFLSVAATEVTDAGLTHLKHCKELEDLGLDATRLGDDGLLHLKGLAKLKLIWLNDTSITDAGLTHLKVLSGLKTLVVAKTQVTAEGLADFQTAVPGCTIEWNGGVMGPKN
jgi:hypothetical protein